MRRLIVFTLVALGACSSAPIEESSSGEGGFQPTPPQTAMPTPVLVAQRTPIERARYPAIDAHFHGRSLDAPEDYAKLNELMDAVGLAGLWSMDGGRSRPLEEDLRMAAEAGGRVVHFARLDYEGLNDPGWGRREAEALRAKFAAGAAGLKVWKDIGLELKDESGEYIHVDDARFDPVWEACAEADKPVLMHVSDPPARFQPIGPDNERYEAGMWRDSPEGNFHGSGVPSVEEILSHRDAALARHPETAFVLAHVASMGWDLARTSDLLEEHSNAHVEISARLQELGRQPYTARRFFLEHQDRVLFGTDGDPSREIEQFWTPHWRFLETDDEYFDHPAQMFSELGAPLQGRWKIHGVFLPDDVLRKIYYENALRLVPRLRAAVESRL